MCVLVCMTMYLCICVQCAHVYDCTCACGVCCVCYMCVMCAMWYVHVCEHRCVACGVCVCVHVHTHLP